MTTSAIDGRAPAGHGSPCLRLVTRGALLLVLAARVLLAPLAEASPPDPTWLAGVWDDGDFDDVICQITALASTADGHPLPTVDRPDACCTLAIADVTPIVPLWRLPRHDRAPPLV